MNAIDTNVLVRFLVNDDPAQARRARVLIESGSVFVAKTVLLESEWVLRFTYEFDAIAINKALTNFCRLAHVVIEDAPIVAHSLKHHAAGMDFADALHLASSARATSFYTFDRSFRNKAISLSSSIQVETP